jgi:hypothetical protein
MKLNALMVRYIVNDVDAAITFYTRNLEFQVTAQSGQYFAILSRENMQLVLSPPKGPGVDRNRCPTAEDLSRAAGIESSCGAATLTARWRF